ncbi:arrestin-related trafficking adapter 1, partial [Lecanoromycetidae sp. Uapishka_2]
MPMPTGIRHAAQKGTKTTKPLKNDFDERPDTVERKLSAERRPAVMDFFHKEKRSSLAGIGRSNTPAKGSPKNSPKLAPAKPARIIIDMESPPLVFYGTTASSSGALLSGQLLLTVTDPEIKLTSLEMVLIARMTFKKPVSKDCPDCKHKDTELFKWKFLTEPTKYKEGGHTFPFSYLLPGHIPATTHGQVGDVDYILDVKALTSMSDTITVSRPLTVQRALQPGSDKISNRIFPPTNLNARVVLPSVIHPIGEFPVQLQMTGIIDNGLRNVERRWRIRRINWRIDEQSKIISPACSKHTSKVGGEGKGVLHDETRSLANEDIKSGWKTDFDTAGGSIEFEFNAAINPNCRPVCDVSSPTGLEVSHLLILELIVAEEQTAGVGKNLAMPTGSARVLRMQFKLTITERSGMGISWDEEMPPMYEDVPNSPPGYTKMDDFEGDLGSDEELERMRQ